jgi:hypothetical protein
METDKSISPSENQKELPLLTPESAAFLLKTAKWGKFLAILGFIVTFFLFLAGILMSFVLGMLPDEMIPLNMPFSPRVFSVFYIVIAGIYIVPVIFLNSFCNNAIKAIENSSTANLTVSLKNLKNLFVFVGISTIVILSFYTIILIIAGTAAIVSF